MKSQHVLLHIIKIVIKSTLCMPNFVHFGPIGEPEPRPRHTSMPIDWPRPALHLTPVDIAGEKSSVARDTHRRGVCSPPGPQSPSRGFRRGELEPCGTHTALYSPPLPQSHARRFWRGELNPNARLCVPALASNSLPRFSPRSAGTVCDTPPHHLTTLASISRSAFLPGRARPKR